MSEIIESQQEELHCAQAEELQRRDQQLLHEQMLQQNSELREAHHKCLNVMEELKKFQSSTFDTIARRRLVDRRLLQGQLWRQKLEFREAHQQSLTEMEELQKFQSSTFDTMARRKLIEDQNTILELSGTIQELQNEINCMTDSRDFQDAESIRSGNSHVTSRPVSFPPHPIFEGMLSRSIRMKRRREGPRSILDTHGISGNVFANPVASSSAPYPQELNPRSSKKSRFTPPQWRIVKGKNKIKIRDASLDSQPKILSSLVRETLQRIVEQTSNDCRFRIFILINSLHQPRLLAGR